MVQAAVFEDKVVFLCISELWLRWKPKVTELELRLQWMIPVTDSTDDILTYPVTNIFHFYVDISISLPPSPPLSLSLSLSVTCLWAAGC